MKDKPIRYLVTQLPFWSEQRFRVLIEYRDGRQMVGHGQHIEDALATLEPVRDWVRGEPVTIAVYEPRPQSFSDFERAHNAALRAAFS